MKSKTRLLDSSPPPSTQTQTYLWHHPLCAVLSLYVTSKGIAVAFFINHYIVLLREAFNNIIVIVIIKGNGYSN